MSVEINLNDFVRVKLNDYGKEIFYHQFDELNKKSGREVIKPYFPKVDDKGYTKNAVMGVHADIRLSYRDGISSIPRNPQYCY